MKIEDVTEYAFYALHIPLFILVIFAVIFIHEMGHFLAARAFGASVKSVVIGRGDLLKQWHDSRGTRWDINMWPFGAHVHLTGMERDEQAGTSPALPYWKRMVITCAGPGINILTPFILLPLFYLAVGQPSGPPIIAGIERGLAGEAAGLQPGDKFLAVDGVSVSDFDEIWRVAYSKGAVESRYTIQREDEVFDLDFTPGWEEYDDDGITRANARFGVIWTHSPFRLSAIMSVDGVDTKKDEDLARTLLVEAFDRLSVISIKGVNDKETFFTWKLHSSLNQGLLDEKSDAYDLVYMGSENGNFYKQEAVLDSLKNGFYNAGKLVINVTTIPFQLLPLDPNRIKEPYRVTNAGNAVSNSVYSIVHMLCLVSVFLALLNLLPLPRLDGGYILIHSLERLRGKSLERRSKAKIYAGAFLIIYMGILFSNMDNLPRYIDSRLKKLQEFIDQDH